MIRFIKYLYSIFLGTTIGFIVSSMMVAYTIDIRKWMWYGSQENYIVLQILWAVIGAIGGALIYMYVEDVDND